MTETGPHKSFRPPPAEAVRALPLLPVRNQVLFPGVEARLRLDQPATSLLAKALPADRVIGVFACSYDGDEETADGLCRVGVAATILRIGEVSASCCDWWLRPLRRIVIRRVRRREPVMMAEVTHCDPIDPVRQDRHWQATLDELRDVARRLAGPAGDARTTPDLARLLKESAPDQLADLVAARLNLGVDGKQDLLEELDVGRRVRAVLRLAGDEWKLQELQRKIRNDTDARFSDSRRRAYLNEQLKVIRRALGENMSEAERQTRDLNQRLAAVNLPPEAKQEAQRQLRRLELLRPSSAEVPVMVNYIETLAELPWNRRTRDNYDLEHVRAIL
ncbi:MAG TPA: LON peptidase substrate-binding domain-containing protein, partial [Candidatus Didemnitutus sp.]|nr:LON peptidase substrate-binding domain-containing protein [Candidatus Didemnitutus sp.]